MSKPADDRHKTEQQRRLAAALRENLKRRKAQAKRRSAVGTATEGAEKPHDSAGISADKSTIGTR